MLLTLGLNHNTAPIEIREKLAFSPERLGQSLQSLAQLSSIEEAAILSTCNRTEIYCDIATQQTDELIAWLASYHRLDESSIRDYLYSHIGPQSIKHMSRVACGLDSLVLGEPQILGQMKTAYQHASEAGTLGKYLGRLFQHTFQVAKKVRTDTAIGSSPVSVAFAGVKLAQQIFGQLQDQTALLIGAGETIELSAQHLKEQGIGRLIVANRTLEKAHAIASQGNGYAIEIKDIPEHLAEADIIISSTASSLPILGKGSVETAISKRKHKPMFMMDLAVPHDIEKEVGSLSDVYLYCVDDLKNIVDDGLQSRREAAEQAEDIIDIQISHFQTWLRAQDASKTIYQLRTQSDNIREELLQKAISAVKNGQPAEQALERLANDLTKKILHAPSSTLKKAASEGNNELLLAAQQLFNLNK
ncbi:MAG: glutamyl-tRNA reductase [Cycloclasticus pugetii]|jgi:glutamyl-tRNA reductase|uniref:Glutamyl-tRNA reductase n=2 Tax=Cycloclasticus TaxID=34067 RepID=S5TVC8_9GAMM|nr:MULTISPECIES: glutamyl-tRNA reductase [Cycloclasticus]AGS39060.1 Glutamyl-tRNA reductase [Cycloclasticus zancles 78-ME]ATI02687.1 glutamyl-tRNA reductase [Cycloclasticus sp. PY97N]EPD12865.1 glutamyl-tRNA reductase [Cycloclasticus pugetii]MBV1899028.1 glutamyl-tRNA reductase [Cycloclasticus sp.]MDF1829935.1 glutamyl-tRNA reductase [Cycloclasticus pugetii]|tara:strand:+ start:859 stop:2109 length:1251 start_codon:yes stop_codon:yes gene_type:complete